MEWFIGGLIVVFGVVLLISGAKGTFGSVFGAIFGGGGGLTLASSTTSSSPSSSTTSSATSSSGGSGVSLV